MEWGVVGRDLHILQVLYFQVLEHHGDKLSLIIIKKIKAFYMKTYATTSSVFCFPLHKHTS